MNESKIEISFNKNQNYSSYTPIVIIVHLLLNDEKIKEKLSIKHTDEDIVTISGVKIFINNFNITEISNLSICKLLISLFLNNINEKYLIVEKSSYEIDIEKCASKNKTVNLIEVAKNLESYFSKNDYKFDSKLSIADIFLWSNVAYSKENFEKFDNFKKWFKNIEKLLENLKILKYLPIYKVKDFGLTKEIEKKRPAKDSKEDKNKNKKNSGEKEGKYVDLPGAKIGQVVVRFPPEASGYLHIGHAKAALLNQHYQQTFEGKFVFRFDDTNPEKEKEDFEKVITEDVELLKIKPDALTYTSDNFPLCLELIDNLLKAGKVYVDDTLSEQMKTEREQKIESINRNNSVEKNIEMWKEMKEGTEYGQKCCVRAKIDMNSDNGCLRDPTLYRCKNSPHPRTGDKYKVYPTYDFACPIVDSVEGITHALRTTEYSDRDSQYYWIIDALNLRKPYIYSYSRLNMTHTVLSKRKLTWFVENKIVDGWDDPRMPTVRGILRRGLTVDGLKQFIIAQGSSRCIVFMEWDKIWSFNRKIIDPISFRFMAVEKQDCVLVNLENVFIDKIEVACHPKNKEFGTRVMKTSNRLLIDQADATLFGENVFVTFINLGNVLIKKIYKDNQTGLIKEVQGFFDPNNKEFKNTIKITWIDFNNYIEAKFSYFENLITKPILDKDDEFKDYINKKSRQDVDFLVENILIDIKKNDIIQLIRKGFFICDQPYDKITLSHTSVDSRIHLFSILDGSTDLNNFPKKIQDIKLRFREKANEFIVKKQSTTSNVKSSDNSNSNSNIKNDENDLNSKIKEQGDKIRNLKSENVAKEQLKPEIDNLLKLKVEYKKLTGKEWKPESSSTSVKNISSTEQSQKNKENKKPLKNQKNKSEDKSLKNEKKSQINVEKAENPNLKKKTRLCIENKKSKNFSFWYTEIITKSEMLDYYDISGCYILRPWAFSIWEKITQFLDTSFKQLGVKNVSFPMFVSKPALELEKNHIADFAPEVAWVTKSGSSELIEPIAIRPTSETVMYPSYSKWIKSHRDLPLKLNQWNNVVRWEFKDPTPFLRSREFLWQEGHTAHALEEEALTEVYKILDIYASAYEDLLAVPMIKGKKTEKEKFPGGEMTTTIEGFISENGRGIQAATSHFLGQNFSKMFDIVFENTSNKKQFVYQNSWGFTTRSIGIMVMEHSDDQGLVLPPKVAPIQVVIIPCGITLLTSDETKQNLISKTKYLNDLLKENEILSYLDDSSHNSPGWKYNNWELKGVPIRIEFGPKNLESDEFVTARRDTFEKQTHKISECVNIIKNMLNDIQSNLFENAKQKRNKNLKTVYNLKDFTNELNNKCLVLTPFCGSGDCEEYIKKETAKNDDSSSILMGAKSLCIPFEQPFKIEDKNICVNDKCSNKPEFYAMFGRSY